MWRYNNMKVKIIHELEDNESDVAKRLLFKDEAFNFLWDIAHDIRGYFKYEKGSKKKAEDLLDQIKTNIHKSKLLDFYT